MPDQALISICVWEDIFFMIPRNAKKKKSSYFCNLHLDSLCLIRRWERLFYRTIYRFTSIVQPFRACVMPQGRVGDFQILADSWKEVWNGQEIDSVPEDITEPELSMAFEIIKLVGHTNWTHVIRLHWLFRGIKAELNSPIYRTTLPYLLGRSPVAKLLWLNMALH